MVWTFMLLSLVILILYGYLTTMKPKNYPPGPVWLPFIGSNVILRHTTKKYGSEFAAFVELSKQYSTKVLGMKTSTELLVIIFGHKNVHQVFNSREFDARPSNLFAQLRCLGKKNMGITFANAEFWKEQRQFAVKNLKYVGYGKSSMDIEIQSELCKILAYIKNNTNQPIDLLDNISESVMNVLWTYVAGERIPQEKLIYLLKLFKERNEAFSASGGVLNQLPWCRFIAPELTGYNLITKINKEIDQIIEEAIQKHKSKEIAKNDFIYMYMQEIFANERPTFTEEQLKIILLDLIIAGSQTSSNTLSFCLLRALVSQDIQDKIYGEIITTVGDRLPCWGDSDRLVYTSAFIQEIFRYYMIVPSAGPRLSLSDTWIDGYLIPKGATILISLGDIYRDPELWEDPHVFRPERFIGVGGKLMNSSHLYPFGSGRRRCPGDALAKSFVFIFLVGILQSYRIQCTNETVPSAEPVVGILSSPKPYVAEFTPRITENRTS